MRKFKTKFLSFMLAVTLIMVQMSATIYAAAGTEAPINDLESKGKETVADYNEAQSDNSMGVINGVTYNKDVSSDYILHALQEQTKKGNGLLDIVTITNHIELNADVVAYLEEKEMWLLITYIAQDDGTEQGKAVVYGDKIKSNEIKGSITIEKPEVSVSTSNATYESMLLAGISSIYLTTKNHIINGVHYIYTNKNVLGSVTDSNTKYMQLVMENGQIIYLGNSLGGGKEGLNLAEGTMALIPADKYIPISEFPSTPAEPLKAVIALKPVTPASPEKVDPVTPPSDPNTATSDKKTDNSSAVLVSDKDIVSASEVNNVLENELNNSVLATVETYSKEVAPTLKSDVFKKMLDSQKAITVGITDANNRLMYSWTFASEQISNPNMDLDLTMTMDTDRADEVKKITGRDDVMYLSFAHHGALPGPATIKNYVGDKYKNGDVIYLYYFNEEKNCVESVGNGGLTVKDGYVEYVITHCSLYFMSQDELITNNTVSSNVSNSVSVATGDRTNVLPYVLGTVLGVIALGVVMIVERKRERN